MNLRSLARPLKVPSGPYVSLQPKQVACIYKPKLIQKLTKLGLATIVVDFHGSTHTHMNAQCPLGLCAHMSHIGSVWASASETFEDTLEALAMGSERHIFIKSNSFHVLELSVVLKALDMTQNEFIDIVLQTKKMAITEASRDHYLSRGLEACPYVLTDFDITFQFE